MRLPASPSRCSWPCPKARTCAAELTLGEALPRQRRRCVDADGGRLACLMIVWSSPVARCKIQLDSCVRQSVSASREWNERSTQVPGSGRRATEAPGRPTVPSRWKRYSYLSDAWTKRGPVSSEQVDGDDGPGGVESLQEERLASVDDSAARAGSTGDGGGCRKCGRASTRKLNQIIQYRGMTHDDPQQANYGLMPIGLRRWWAGRQTSGVHERLLDTGRPARRHRDGRLAAAPRRGDVEGGVRGLLAVVRSGAPT